MGEIGGVLLVLLWVSRDDGPDDVSWMAEKIATLRIFLDYGGKMNLSLGDAGGEALVVSQFTLYGDARRGRRPSFTRAGQGPRAEELYEDLVARLRALGVRCATGSFGAMMSVELTNEGPVTILLDSDKLF